MKRTAIILSILLFAQAAFAGGTVLYMNPDGDSSYNTQNETSVENPDDTTKQTYKKKTIRIGAPKNDPNAYWNYGSVNFGSGFSSTGGSVKRY